MLIDETAIQVCRNQVAPTSSGGLGFSLRILWAHANSRDISDLLIIDGVRSFSIDALANGEFGELAMCIDPTAVAMKLRMFDDLWLKATPSEHFIESS